MGFGYIICDCGNGNQGAFRAEIGGDLNTRKSPQNPRPMAVFKGWKCLQCGRINKDPIIGGGPELSEPASGPHKRN